jgi:hypothetical protein
MEGERRLARIESTFLGYEEHGIFTAYLHLEYAESSGHQGAGGYYLDAPADDGGRGRKGTAYGCDWISRVLRTVGVDSWEQLTDKQVYAWVSGGLIVGIESGPFAKQRRTFDFREHSESFAAERAPA